jgi:hypothetical protein
MYRESIRRISPEKAAHPISSTRKISLKRMRIPGPELQRTPNHVSRKTYSAESDGFDPVRALIFALKFERIEKLGCGKFVPPHCRKPLDLNAGRRRTRRQEFCSET